MGVLQIYENSLEKLEDELYFLESREDKTVETTARIADLKAKIERKEDSIIRLFGKDR